MADGERIITTSSSTTALMLPGYAAYDAAKGAAEQFTRILAQEFGTRQITVNAVSPEPPKPRQPLILVTSRIQLPRILFCLAWVGTTGDDSYRAGAIKGTGAVWRRGGLP